MGSHCAILSQPLAAPVLLPLVSENLPVLGNSHKRNRKMFALVSGSSLSMLFPRLLMLLLQHALKLTSFLKFYSIVGTCILFLFLPVDCLYLLAVVTNAAVNRTPRAVETLLSFLSVVYLKVELIDCNSVFSPFY